MSNLLGDPTLGLASPILAFDVGVIRANEVGVAGPGQTYYKSTYSVSLLSYNHRAENVGAVQWAGGMAGQGETRYPPNTPVLIGYMGSDHTPVILGALPHLNSINMQEGRYSEVLPGSMVLQSSMPDSEGNHSRPGAKVEIGQNGVVSITSGDEAATVNIGRADGDENEESSSIHIGTDRGVSIDVSSAGTVMISSIKSDQRTTEARCQIEGSSFTYVDGDSQEYVEGDKIILGKTGSVIQISKDGDITLKDKKGNCISLNSTNGEVSMASSSGQDFVHIKEKEIYLQASDDVTIGSGDRVTLFSPTVALGFSTPQPGVARLGDYCATFCPLVGLNVAGEIADPAKMPPGIPIPKNAGVGAKAPSATVTAQD